MNYEELSEKYNTLLKQHNTLMSVSKIIFHDVRSTLRFFGDLAESLNLDKKTQITDKDIVNLKLMAQSSRDLYFLASNMLEWFVNTRLDFSLKQEKINLLELAGEISNIYAKQIQFNNNTLNIEIDKDFIVTSNREVLSIIARNAVDNANKYTRNGVIRIKCNPTGDAMFFIIQDNGQGFDYKRLVQKLKSENQTSSKIIGYKIIHDMAKQIGITYDLQSEIGIGTILTLSIPV